VGDTVTVGDALTSLSAGAPWLKPRRGWRAAICFCVYNTLPMDYLLKTEPTVYSFADLSGEDDDLGWGDESSGGEALARDEAGRAVW